MFVCSLAPEKDNIKLISRLCKDDFGSNRTVFDLSRPLEGRYGPGLVLRRDILVVYGVVVLSSA